MINIRYKLGIAEYEYFIREGLCHGIAWDAMGFEVAFTVGDGIEAYNQAQKTPVDVLLTDNIFACPG